MSITMTSGDLLKQDVDAIVNTVNCVGVMGKGIALQFKKKWPANFDSYANACKTGDVILGKMFIYDSGGLVKPNFIINFPTKGHWKEKSKIQHIESGLDDLVCCIQELNIQSIAIPPLGCGNGGLDWQIVYPIIEKKLSMLNIDVRVFEPNGSPPVKEMIIRGERPLMTLGRAAIIKLLEIYKELGYGLSRIEVQKLAYFLQVSGESLKLEFEKNAYGPYSDTLRHVLHKMDGHFIIGVGDGTADSEIEPITTALNEADAFIQKMGSSEFLRRIERIHRLIDGYQSPYGMELLATVHWVANKQNAHSIEDATHQIQNWNERKRQIIKPEHIKIAWNHLKSESWI